MALQYSHNIDHFVNNDVTIIFLQSDFSSTKLITSYHCRNFNLNKCAARNG